MTESEGKGLEKGDIEEQCKTEKTGMDPDGNTIKTTNGGGVIGAQKRMSQEKVDKKNQAQVKEISCEAASPDITEKVHATRKKEGPSEAGRRSTRLRGKRPRLTEIITTSDEDNLESDNDDDDFLEERETKVRNKRGRSYDTRHLCPPSKSEDDEEEEEEDEEDEEGEDDDDLKGQEKTRDVGTRKRSKVKKTSEPPSKIPKEYATGAFVVSKIDFHASTTPAIWRIDGKALLQKYVHFEKDGQTLYKNTSTYSGWTVNHRDQYFPATIELVSQNRKETLVKFKRELIVDDDSD